MKSILSALFIVLACLQAYAGNVVTDFSAKASSSCVTFSYTFKVKNQLNMQGEGKAVVQGNSFHVTGNGLDIWCDGKTRWTVDNAAKEIIIEPVDQSVEDYSTNPALLVSSVEKAFDVTSVADAKFNGKSVTAGTLKPKARMDMTSVKLYFQKENLAGAAVTMKDGTVTEFTVSGLAFNAKRPASEFSFNEKTLDKKWVITDLR